MLSSLLRQENETVRQFRQDTLHFCGQLRPALQQASGLIGRAKYVVLAHTSLRDKSKTAGAVCVIVILWCVCLQHKNVNLPYVGPVLMPAYLADGYVLELGLEPKCRSCYSCATAVLHE
jgi:hypothetical protein